MQNILLQIDSFISFVLDSLGIYGPILGCFLILIESILPMLPLSVFITLNFYAFGHVWGFIISNLLTVMGCNMAFYLCRRVLKGRFEYLVKRFEKNRALKLVKRFSNIKLSHLVTIMAFPFTPAFLINIFGGVSEMDHKKFLVATLMAKPFMVYFWGFLGVTLLESLTHPEYFIRVIVMVVIAYISSTIVNKKFDLD